MRIAGLLHLAADIENGYSTPISGDTMRSAIDLGRYFTAHASAAFGEMVIDPLVKDAYAIIEWCQRKKAIEFSKRELFQGIRSGHFQKTADLDAPLALLGEHGYIRLAADSRTTPKGGRPTSPRFAVHPEILSGCTEPTQPTKPE